MKQPILWNTTVWAYWCDRQ